MVNSVLEFSGELSSSVNCADQFFLERMVFCGFIGKNAAEVYSFEISDCTLSPICYANGSDDVYMAKVGEALWFVDKNSSVKLLHNNTDYQVEYTPNLIIENDDYRLESVVGADTVKGVQLTSKFSGAKQFIDKKLINPTLLPCGILAEKGEFKQGARRWRVGGGENEVRAFTLFDYAFSEVWEAKISKGRHINAIVVCNEGLSILFYLEVDNNDVGSNRKLLMLDASNGRMLWERELDDYYDQVYFDEGDLYLCGNNRLLVVDAIENRIVIDKSHKLFDDGDALGSMRVCSRGECLWFFSSSGVIRVMDRKVGGVIKEYRLKPPISSYEPEDWRLSLVFDCFPSFFQGKVFVVAKLGADCLQSVLFVFDEDMSSNTEFEYQARPNCKVSEYSNAGGHGYRIEIDHENEEELVRFSQIQLIELARYYAGTTRYSTEGRDKGFSGQLVLSVQNKVLSDEAKVRLDQMRQEVEWMLEDQGYYAEQNKANISVRIEYPA